MVVREIIGFVDIRCNCRVVFRRQSRNGDTTTNRFEAKDFCFLFFSFRILIAIEWLFASLNEEV